MQPDTRIKRTFHLILIKPVRYDEEGYPIQWRRAVYPSLALSVLNGLAEDCAQRKVLGPDTGITIEAWDDQCGLPKMEEMIDRARSARAGCLVGMVAVHTAQFPRCAALARQFRAAGVPVIIGGSHVSGCLAVMPELPPELRELKDMGVSFFRGEAEGRLALVIRDAARAKLAPVYNFAGKPVAMEEAVMPSRLPENVQKRIAQFLDPMTPIEAGRGCPRKCSFCTVVNVHGRKARSRTSEAVATYIRDCVKEGRNRFLFTDDNFARNLKWKEILLAMIRLKEEEGLDFTFVLQADTRSHRIPDFIDLAARAGCNQVFVGMESINPDSLASVHKEHNSVDNYQEFCLAWKARGMIVMAGYILGFPTDTPDTIRRDLAIIKNELPVDLLYPFILTPLPGSEDHAGLVRRGVPLDPDLNRYTTFHATRAHDHMSGAELEAVYHEAFRIFYEDAHCLRVLKRHAAFGGDLDLLIAFMIVARNGFLIEGLNPAENGIIRMKSRLDRRPDLPLEPLIPFMARRAWETVSSQLSWWRQLTKYKRMARYAEKHPARWDDPALIRRNR